MATSGFHVCDTLPAARLASPDRQLDQGPQVTTMVLETSGLNDFGGSPRSDHSSEQDPTELLPIMQQPSPRKLCVRHQRMADEGMNVKLQQSLDALALEERQAVNTVWSNFSSSSHRRRGIILQGLLTMCCFSQLSLISEQLARLIRIDPFTVLPKEISLKILGYLDATSLCRAAQVTKRWKALADDNVLWRGICEQHIGQKCSKCGWLLPVLDKKRRACRQKLTPLCPQMSLSASSSSSSSSSSSLSITPSVSRVTSSSLLKRSADSLSNSSSPPLKRHRSNEASYPPRSSTSPFPDDFSLSSSIALVPPEPLTVTRPWKAVYSERMVVELNWRRGKCTTRTLTGHSDGVMCLQFSETLSHPAFPVLISGSYDRTVRVWNMETGEQLHCLRGHTRAVRALQFDEVTLITGSMDRSLKVWDWREGKCIKTLNGHTGGVVCLNYDSNVLASGGVDSMIKIWNLRTSRSFTLRGHSDWVNAVQLWDSNPNAQSAATRSPIFARRSGSMSPISSNSADASAAANCCHIDPGKMLFSASDDGSIRLWDLNARTCVRQFVGHMGQVQSLKLLFASEHDEEEGRKDITSNSSQNPLIPKRKKPVLVSGSLDNTIKLWDIETGKTTRTYFGHIEGVWAVASDKMRLVSGSHDRTIKVWSRDSEKCLTTLIEHQAAVTCLAVSEDKVVSGSDDCTIKIWSFSD